VPNAQPARRLPARLAAALETPVVAIGNLVAWCAILMVIVEFAVVLMRYVFGIGSVALQESVIYLHAATFMLACGAVLARDGHVRVDVVYGRIGARWQALVDLLGALFFVVPLAVLTFHVSLPYVARSWAILEGSRETSGLPFVYLLKTLIPAFAVLLAVQGISMALRAFAALAAGNGER
jgi:TRAP-type mannitol/chloroaromatic compound transport system permease small subunit